MRKVQVAWDDPVDWADLSIYGLYALEAAVMAVAAAAEHQLQRQHWAKAAAARELAKEHDPPDVSELMERLNQARKAQACGDIEAPELDAEDVAGAARRMRAVWWTSSSRISYPWRPA